MINSIHKTNPKNKLSLNKETLRVIPRDESITLVGGGLTVGVVVGITVEATWRGTEAAIGIEEPKGPGERLFELTDNILNNPDWNPLNWDSFWPGSC